MNKSIGVIAAHPDDEVLGCAGTMAKHLAQGDDVHVFILAEGITARDQHRDAKRQANQCSALKKCALKANDIIGSSSVTFGDFPDNRMDGCELLVIVKAIEAFIADKKPSIIYTHHSSDVNIDHQRIHQAVVTAARSTPSSTVETLLFFEVLSSTEWQVAGGQQSFQPNWFVDITASLPKKLAALSAYTTEIRHWPHPRSTQGVDALAKLRGCTIGVDAAEAFVLGRKVIHDNH